MTNIILFETEKELSELTGLDHDELWDTGFNLDDWDWGFRTPQGHPSLAEQRLLELMDSYACGFKEVFYNGYYYYIQYHA